MVDHISHVVRSCYIQMRNAAKIQKYLPQDATVKLMQAFIISRLDNLNYLLHGLLQHKLHCNTVKIDMYTMDNKIILKSITKRTANTEQCR